MCVPNCDDRSSKRHMFPKDETLLKTWINNVNAPCLKDVTPDELYRSYYVCNRHFPSEFLVVGTRRGLRKDAVPTLYLPEVDRDNRIDQHGRSETATPPTFHEMRGDVNLQMYPPCIIHESDELTSLSLPGPSGIGKISKPRTVSQSPDAESNPPITVPGKRRQKKRRQSVNVTRAVHLTPKCKKFYKMLCEWGQKNSRLNSKCQNLNTRLANATKVVNNSNFTQLMERVNEPTYTFIMQQVKNQNLKPKARKFTLDEKVLSLTIFKASGKGYRLLSKIFCLPSRKTLTNLLNHITLRPGINKHIVDTLKVTVSKLKDPKDKICAVVFDEMTVSSLLSYNRKLDCIDGLEDDGNHRRPKIVNHVNMFMIKGIYRQWKQPFCFTFSSGPTKSVELKGMIKQVISVCQDTGLDVVATVCDQGGPNVAAINELLKETAAECVRTGVENKHFGFLVNHVEIIPLYDVPHLFKGKQN